MQKDKQQRNEIAVRKSDSHAKGVDLESTKEDNVCHEKMKEQP